MPERKVRKRLSGVEWEAYRRLAFHSAQHGGYEFSALAGRPGLAAMFRRLKRFGLASDRHGSWRALPPKV